ncbi:hypothetical protein HDE_12858 [Halotydeus destructor]|nr:hypothetical protein HDE_12858 [Halotydeus destructor]
MNQIVLILAISCLATVSLAHGPGGPRDPEKMKEWCAKEVGPEDEARYTCRITNQSDESKAAGETCATKMGATMPKSAKEAKAMMCDP